MPTLGVIVELELRSIRPSPYNPRVEYGRLDELTASIHEKGLLQPLIVRPVRDHFEVVAGNRRLEACRRLGWRKVACHIIELDDREAFEVSLIENIQRRTLHPFEVAKAFKKYVEEYGWGGVSELAKRIGKSQEYVSRRIQLLNLPAELQDELEANHLSPTVAEELLSLRDPEEQLELGYTAVSNSLTKRQVRSIVRSVKSVETSMVSDSYSHQSRNVSDMALRRAIVILRIALIKIDETIDYAGEEWMTRELLMEHRHFLHDRISSLVRARRRLRLLHDQTLLETGKPSIPIVKRY